MLEYTIDEVPEGITYASRSKKEDGSVFLPVVGQFSSESIRIGENFTGFMDEFRITKDFVTDPFTHKYAKTGGAMITRLFDLVYNGSSLLSVSPVSSAPGNTAVRYYYYCTDILSPLTSPEDPAWREIQPGEAPRENATGRFLQLMAKLFTDGYGEHTPAVSEIVFEYESDFPPTVPGEVRAIPGDKKITISWKPVADTDAAGYLVYYGETPGMYWGTESNLGSSPIDVGNVTEITVSNLDNNKLYYFSIVAYDTTSPPHHSGFSEEVSARPSGLRE